MNSTESTILATLVLEVLGRPPEHVTETLEGFVKQIGEEKGVEIKDSKIHEPKELENQEGFFTAFAEIDIACESMKEIVMLCFKYMPSHLEIVSPEKLVTSNTLLNDAFNELVQRLHAYDHLARVLQTEKDVLEKQLKEKDEEKKD